jgi:hypothetical protein
MATQSENLIQTLGLEKAEISTESFGAEEAGKLPPKLAERFEQYVRQLTTLNGNVRIETFRNEEWESHEISLGKRMAMSHREATDPQRRRGVSHKKLVLKPSEIVVPLEITERYMKHNLTGASAEDMILQMIARAFANDREDLFLNGNLLGHASLQSDLFEGGSTTGFVKDDYLGLQQGWSELAEGGVILDAEGSNISPALFNRAMQVLPEKYQRDLPSMRFLLPTILDHKYNEKIAQRQTAGGDAALAGADGQAFGIPRVKVPLWNFYPIVTEHVTLNGTTAVQLKNKPIKEIVAVTPSDLDLVPVAAFEEGTDYTVDLTEGLIARDGGGSIGDGATVKVTYRAMPQMLFTNMNNLIIGIGLDVTILRSKDIYRNVDQYAMHARVGVQIQNVDAIVKVKNIGDG